MAVQYSLAINNARLDLLESTIGTSAKLRIYTGAAPANCAAAASGTMLCEISLPSDWMSAASAGVKAKLGTWAGTAVAAGTAAHFRIWNTGVTVCGMQGTCGLVSGDLSLDNNVIAVSQPVTVTSFSITSAGL